MTNVVQAGRIALAMLCMLAVLAACGTLQPDPDQITLWQHLLMQQDEHG